MSSNSIWMTKTLGEILKDIGDGGTPNTNKKEYFDGAIPWVVIQDIKKEISNTKTTLTEQGLKSCSAKLWPAGTIILSTGATIGEVGVAQKPLATKQGIHGLVCGKEIESKFLFYQIQTLRNYLKANAQGSTIREVRAPFLKTIPINFPKDKSEQSKIAEVLSTVDKAIEQTEALIAKQQRIKTGLMQDLLTRGIDEHGNLRSEETHEFKDSPLGRIPVEWSWDVLRTCLKTSPQNGLYKPQSAYSQSGTPIVRIDGYQHGDRINSRVFKRVRLTSSNIDHYSLFKGNILINRVNSIEYLGKSALIGVLPEPTVFESNMMRLQIDKSKVLPEFVLLVLVSLTASVHFLRLAKLAVAQTSINQSDVGSLWMQIPLIEEQTEIVKRIYSSENYIKYLCSNFSKLRSLKTALMQDLLTGKVRVTPLMENMEVGS